LTQQNCKIVMSGVAIKTTALSVVAQAIQLAMKLIFETP